MLTANSRGRAVLALAICCLFFSYGYMVRIEPAVLVGSLMADFGINASAIGSIVSTVYIAYLAMQLPAGLIIDRFGLGIVVPVGCVLCAAGAYVFGSAGTVLHLVIGRFCIGFATSAAFLCCGRAAIEYPDPRRHGIIIGLVNFTGVMMGGLAGGAPLIQLSSRVGWRGATYVISALGVLLFALAFLCLKHRRPTGPAQEPKSSIKDGLRAILKNRTLWLLGLYGAMLELPITAIAELWGVPFIERRFGVPTDVASVLPVSIFISFGLGGVFATWIAEKIGWKSVMVLCAAGLAASFVSAVYLDDIGFQACRAAMSLAGFFGGANILCFLIAAKLISNEFKGTAMGFMNVLVMSSGIVFQPCLGRLLDFFRHGLVTGTGEPIYNITTYRSAFLLVVVGMLIAVFVPFFCRFGSIKRN